MQFTIISQPSKYDVEAMNYFIIRTEDGATVGMVDEEVVDDLMKLFRTKNSLKKTADNQLKIPFED